METLRHFVASDDHQRRLRDEFLTRLVDRSDALDRTCLPDHLTASAVVLSPGGDSVLLDLHRKVGRWLQFGGHVEPGDHDLAATALREAVEESGIDDLVLVTELPLRLDRHPAPCAPGRARDHLDVQFVAGAPVGRAPTVSAESHDVQWFPVDSLPELTDASVRALVEDAVAAVNDLASPKRR
jgi:8-oxo-dGTP pyrophosphatase MutT (NUDIX family)